MKLKTSIIILTATISTIALPLTILGCSTNVDPNAKEPEVVIPLTVDKIEEAEVLFYESLFNSNYFNKMLLTSDSFTKDEVINFAKQHPEIKNFDSQTQTLINAKLNNINISENDQNQEIKLNVKNIEFKHNLVSLNPEDTYTFEKETNQVLINIDDLNSFEEIFNVLGDIWNLKPKFNSLTLSPYAQIYDYEFENTSIHNQNVQYLDKRAEVNRSFANVYSWDFEKKIVFQNSDGDNFKFENTNLIKDFKSLLSLLSLYNEQNNYVSYSDNQYLINSSPTETNSSLVANFAAYPTIYFDDPSFEASDKVSHPVSYEEWNPIYKSFFLPKNSDIFYERILNEIYTLFYNFSKSNVFINRLSNESFDKEVKIFEYDNKLEKGILRKYSDLDYKNAPENISPEKIKNKNSRSYLEYMLTQWLFNSAQYVNDFEDVALTENDIKQTDFEVKIDSESQEKQIIIKNKELENFLVYHDETNLFFPNESLYLDHLYLADLDISPKYGFRFSWKAFFGSETVFFGVKLYLENNEWKAQGRYIEEFFEPQDKDLLIFDDSKLKNNPRLIIDNNNNISDLINIKYNWKKLQNLIDNKEIIATYKESREEVLNPDDGEGANSGYNKGQITINIDLSPTNLFFSHFDKKIGEILNQKLEIKINIEFYYGFFIEGDEASISKAGPKVTCNFLD